MPYKDQIGNALKYMSTRDGLVDGTRSAGARTAEVYRVCDKRVSVYVAYGKLRALRHQTEDIARSKQGPTTTSRTLEKLYVCPTAP